MYKIHTVQQTRLFLHHDKIYWCDKCVLHLITFCPLSFWPRTDEMRGEIEHDTIYNISYREDFWHDMGLVSLTKIALTSSQDLSLLQRVASGCFFFLITERGKWLLWGGFLSWDFGLVFLPEVANNNAAKVIERCEDLWAMDLNTIDCPSVSKVQLPYQPHVSSWDNLIISLFWEERFFLLLPGPDKQLAWLIAAIDSVLQSKTEF